MPDKNGLLLSESIVSTLSAPVVIFDDVDDNRIKACRQVPPEGGTAVAFDESGEATGFLTPKQQTMLDLLLKNALVVPTTARTSDGFKRVMLPYPGWAIVSFGGVILAPEGMPEPRWHERMQIESKKYEAELNRLLSIVQKTAAGHGIDARARIVEDFGLNLFLSVKHNRKNLAELKTIADQLQQELAKGFALHFNGNFVAVMPPFLRKEYAVQWFIENMTAPGAVLIGSGDSLTDLKFIGICDWALIPTRSQSFSTLVREVSEEDDN